MKKQIWHNPENVPAFKVPKGWRFRRIEEVSVLTPAKGGCRMWESENNGWSKDDWAGISPFRTYIVPKKAAKAFKIPKVKPSKKQETLWAILSHHTKSIVPATVAYLRKDAWAAMEACMGIPVESLKQEGHRAVKVTVSYEVKE